MFINPHRVLARLDLRDGMRVADLGCGTGMYTKSALSRVGYTGKVYAVDVQRDLVKKLAEELENVSFGNVECMWGDIEKRGGTRIADTAVDAVILSNVLFQVEDKLGLIDETKRILKKGGKVLVVDWLDSFNGMGPHPQYVVNAKKASDLFSLRGFTQIQTISASDHHYGIIFTHE